MPEIDFVTAILENMTISIKLTEDKLELQEFYDSLSDPKCGGTVVFQGTVRNVFYPDTESLNCFYLQKMTPMIENDVVRFFVVFVESDSIFEPYIAFFTFFRNVVLFVMAK